MGMVLSKEEYGYCEKCNVRFKGDKNTVYSVYQGCSIHRYGNDYICKDCHCLISQNMRCYHTQSVSCCFGRLL